MVKVPEGEVSEGRSIIDFKQCSASKGNRWERIKAAVLVNCLQTFASSHFWSCIVTTQLCFIMTSGFPVLHHDIWLPSPWKHSHTRLDLVLVFLCFPSWGLYSKDTQKVLESTPLPLIGYNKEMFFLSLFFKQRTSIITVNSVLCRFKCLMWATDRRSHVHVPLSFLI